MTKIHKLRLVCMQVNSFHTLDKEKWELILKYQYLTVSLPSSNHFKPGHAPSVQLFSSILHFPVALMSEVTHPFDLLA